MSCIFFWFFFFLVIFIMTLFRLEIFLCLKRIWGGRPRSIHSVRLAHSVDVPQVGTKIPLLSVVLTIRVILFVA
jgi:hypothetical protein